MMTVIMRRFRGWRINRAHRRLVRYVALNEFSNNILTRFLCEFAAYRFAKLLDKTPRYWQAGAIGGGSVLTFHDKNTRDVLTHLYDIGATIAYIDSPAGFIAYHPKSNESHPVH